jgi:type III pantothenate kinase
MLLAIDCGNSNTVFGLHEGADAEAPFLATWRMETEGFAAKECLRRLDQELAAVAPARASVDDTVIASVVPSANAALVECARQASGADPLVIGDPGVDLGIEVMVDKPGEVGADRLVNAIAAHSRWPGPLIVLDFGTATTFDVITADGDYAGGVIAPGINLALDALHAGAAMLPRVEVKRPPKVIGGGTVGAMQSGIYWGYVGLIEGITARIKAEYAATDKFTVIATGGLAPLFAGGTDEIGATDPDLTLRGLVHVYLRNRE